MVSEAIAAIKEIWKLSGLSEPAQVPLQVFILVFDIKKLYTFLKLM